MCIICPIQLPYWSPAVNYFIVISNRISLQIPLANYIYFPVFGREFINIGKSLTNSELFVVYAIKELKLLYSQRYITNFQASHI